MLSLFRRDNSIHGAYLRMRLNVMLMLTDGIFVGNLERDEFLIAERRRARKWSEDMVRLRKVMTNTAISLAGQMVTWISTLLLTIAYGRFLGDAKFGELYFAIAFVGLIGFPLDIGFNQQISREIARAPERAVRYLTNALFIKSVLWVGLYGLLLVLCWVLHYDAELRVLLMICGVTLLSSSFASAFRSAQFAFDERSIFPVVGSIIEKGLAALIGVSLLRHGMGVLGMALVLLAASLAGTTWQAIWFARLVGVSVVIDRALIRSLIQTSVPFLAYGAIVIIYYRIDTVLLSFMTNSAVIGWYGAAYRLFDTMSFLPNIVIASIMYPIFAKLSANSDAGLKVAIEKSTNFLLFCSIPIAAGLIVTAPQIIGFLYQRPEFAHSIPALQALAPGIVFLYLNFVCTSTLVSTKRERKLVIMAAAALVFNVGLNLILIPRYQHVAAAGVTTLTEALLLGLGIVLLPRHLLPVRSLIVGLKATIASAVMTLVIVAVGWDSIVVIIPVAAFVYVSVALLLGTIPRDDLQALFTAIRIRTQQTSEPTASERQIAEQPGAEVVQTAQSD